MVVPAHIHTHSLTGRYALNRTLSSQSDLQEILKMQSVAWIVRQAVKYSNVLVTLRQYTTSIPDSGADPSGQMEGPAGQIEVQHLDQVQFSTGGMENREDRILDNEMHETTNKIWGPVRGRTRLIFISTLAQEKVDPWLLEGWDASCQEHGVIEGFVEGVKEGWTAQQVWGFAEVDGQRRQVRKVLARREGWKERRGVMVYDWVGDVEDAKDGSAR